MSRQDGSQSVECWQCSWSHLHLQATPSLLVTMRTIVSPPSTPTVLWSDQFVCLQVSASLLVVFSSLAGCQQARQVRSLVNTFPFSDSAPPLRADRFSSGWLIVINNLLSLQANITNWLSQLWSGGCCQAKQRRQEVHRQGGDGGGDRVRRRGAVRPQLRQEVPHHLCDKLFGVGFYIQ